MGKLYLYRVCINISKIDEFSPDIIKSTTDENRGLYGFIHPETEIDNADVDYILYEDNKNVRIEIILRSESEKDYGSPNIDRIVDIFRSLAIKNLHNIIRDDHLGFIGLLYEDIDNAIDKLKDSLVEESTLTGTITYYSNPGYLASDIHTVVECEIYENSEAYIVPGTSVLIKAVYETDRDIWHPYFVTKCNMHEERKDRVRLSCVKYGDDLIGNFVFYDTPEKRYDQCRIIDDNVRDIISHKILKAYDEEIKDLEKKIKDLEIIQKCAENAFNTAEHISNNQWRCILSNLSKPIEVNL